MMSESIDLMNISSFSSRCVTVRKNYSCFFVMGHARSGTTALARLLNKSSEIACLFYEGNVLYRLWRILSRRDILSEPHEELILDLKATSEHNLIDRSKTAGEPKVIFSRDLISAFIKGFRKDLKESTDPLKLYFDTAHRFFKLFKRNTQLKILGDKVPDYVNIPEVLSLVFPHSKILYLTRDPRAIVHSTKHFLKKNLHLFAVPDAFAMGYSILLRHRNMVELSGRLPTSEILFIAQEELKERPESVALKVSGFFNILNDPRMSEYAVEMRKGIFIKNWYDEMIPEDIAAVEAVFHGTDSIESFIVDPEKNPWLEKAINVHRLTTCRADQILSVVDSIIPLFENPTDRKTLGYTLLQIASFSHARAEFEKAHIFYQQAGRFIPTDPVFWFKFGDLCFDMKYLEKASSCYKSALDLSSSNGYSSFVRAKSLFQLGRIQRLSGKKETAKEYYRKSIHVFPEFKLARNMLANI